MEKCQIYKGVITQECKLLQAEERKYFGNNVVFCPILPKNCPYGKAHEQEFEGESVGTLCVGQGLVKKVNKNAKFNLDFPKKLPVELV